MIYRIAAAIAALLLLAWGWVASASAIYCYGRGVMPLLTFPYLQWIDAIRWWNYSNWVTLWVAVGGVVPTGVVALIGLAIFQSRRRLRRRLTPATGGGVRPIQPGVTDNHGHAAWATQQQVLGRFGRQHGCLIGALDRSPNAPLLFDDLSSGPGHCMTIAGPGSDKSTTAVSRIYHWCGPRVVFDPSCEIAPIMMQALEDAGCNVTTIGLNAGGVNVLDWIDVQHPEAEAHIRSAVDWIYDENAGYAQSDAAGAARDPYWAKRGRALVVCLMADMLYEPNMDLPRTLATLRLGISQPEDVMQDLLRGIHTNSHSPMARSIAAGLMGMKAQETFSSVYSNADSATEWLSVGAYADIVSGDAVRTADILDSRTVLFVQIPLRTLESTPGVGRAVMGALFNALIHADGAIDHTVLFEIDEAATLGAMKEIRLFHRTARKYRGLMHTIWQSGAQLDETWGEKGARVLRDCCAWRSYNAVQDGDVAEKLSRDIGEHAVMAWSEGINTGQQRQPFAWAGSKSRGENVSEHEIKRRLILASEILRAPADEMFVLARDFSYPIRCFTSPYWRYPSIAKRMSNNRFARNNAA